MAKIRPRLGCRPTHTHTLKAATAHSIRRKQSDQPSAAGRTPSLRSNARISPAPPHTRRRRHQPHTDAVQHLRAARPPTTGHHEFPSEPGKLPTGSAKDRFYRCDWRTRTPVSAATRSTPSRHRPSSGGPGLKQTPRRLSVVADFAQNIDLATGARSPGKACICGDQYDVESLGQRNVGGIVGRQDMPQFPYPVEQWLNPAWVDSRRR